MKPIPNAVLALLCLAGLTACTTGAGEKSAATPLCADTSQRPALADDGFRSALWQQSAAEYDALSLQVFARAEVMLKRAIARPHWSALDASEAPTPLNGSHLAIITDIDETLLDNSPFTVRQMREPMPACMTVAEARSEWDRRWLEWVRDAEATALPGAAEFMQRAVARSNANIQIEVFYVTNRKDEEKEATCANLKQVGFPLRDCATQVLTRNDEDGRGKDKISRRQRIAAKHRVVLMFGDNLGDFVGNILTNETARNALVAGKKDWWGQRWFMLPNPSYGSWEEILNRVSDRPDDFATAAARNAYLRAQKEKRLEDCRSNDCLTP